MIFYCSGRSMYVYDNFVFVKSTVIFSHSAVTLRIFQPLSWEQITHVENSLTSLEAEKQMKGMETVLCLGDIVQIF